MAELAVEIPEDNRRGLICEVLDVELLDSLGDLLVVAAGLADSGQVALDVGDEDRHADPAELLGNRVDRDRLAGAGCAGDEPMAVGHPGQQVLIGIAPGDKHRISHEIRLPSTKQQTNRRPLCQRAAVVRRGS